RLPETNDAKLRVKRGCRNYLSLLPSLLRALRFFVVSKGFKMKNTKIKEVRAFIIDPGEAGADYHNQGKGHWIVDRPIANPMSIYEQYKANRTSWGINALGTVVCEV